MKVVVFLVSFVLFIAALLAMGYAFAFDGWVASGVFLGGILLASFAYIIPFHLLEKAD